MPGQIFIVPKIGSGTRSDPFRAKYIVPPPEYVPPAFPVPAAIEATGTIEYGESDPAAILRIVAAQEYLDFIESQGDTILLGTDSNLDQNPAGNERGAIRSGVEALDIPGNWISPQETRREVIRGLSGIFLFAQVIQGRTGQSWRTAQQNSGVTLQTSWGGMPDSFQDDLIIAAEQVGFPIPNKPWREPWQPDFLPDENGDLTIPNPPPADYQQTIPDNELFRALMKQFGDTFQTKPVSIAGLLI